MSATARCVSERLATQADELPTCLLRYPNYVYQPANLAPKPAKAKLTVKKTSSPKASKAAAVARSRKKKARSDESDSDVSEDSDDQGGSDDEYMA